MKDCFAGPAPPRAPRFQCCTSKLGAALVRNIFHLDGPRFSPGCARCIFVNRQLHYRKVFLPAKKEMYSDVMKSHSSGLRRNMVFGSGFLRMITADVMQNVENPKSCVFENSAYLFLSHECAAAPPSPPNTMLGCALGARHQEKMARGKVSVYFERPEEFYFCVCPP